MFLIMLNDHCCVFSYARIFAILWTVARQAALSLGFSQQEYWNGLLFPPPGDLLHPGIKPSSVQFSRSVVSDSLRPHESQHARPPCPSPTPGVHSDSRPSIESVMPSSHLILCCPLLLLPQSLPASRSFK